MSLRSEIIRVLNELLSNSKKISDLPTATTPTGTELVEIVQGGANKKTTVADLGGGGGGTVDHWRGGWDPTAGLPVDADAIGSGTSGAIQEGDQVIFTDVGVDILGDGEDWPVDTIALSKQDSPTLPAHWRLW